MTDIIILIICGVLLVLLTIILIWWLKVGKQHFIEKRCPERMTHTEKGADHDVISDDTPPISLIECYHGDGIDIDKVEALARMIITNTGGEDPYMEAGAQHLLEIAICRSLDENKTTFDAVIDTLRTMDKSIEIDHEEWAATAYRHVKINKQYYMSMPKKTMVGMLNKIIIDVMTYKNKVE